MRHFIQSLRPSVEFAVVVLGAFGYLVVISLLAAVGHYASAGQLSDCHFAALLGYELVVTLLLLGFLHLRGWTRERLGVQVNAVDTLIGFALAGAAYAAYFLVYVAIALAWPQAALAVASPHVSSSAGISLATAIVVSLVNPVFEEVFVCGYIIAALRKSSNPWIGVHVSVAIRLLYHLYQGAAALLAAVPFGLIAALWYQRTGKLWPVIVAHAVIDFIGLLAFVR